jgi:hypothetical protein
MSRPARRTARFLLIALLLTSLVASTKAEEAVAEQPGAEAAAEAAAAEPAAAEPEPVVLNCQAAELIEPLATWSVDCTALWLENLGFGACAPGEVEGTAVGGEKRPLAVGGLVPCVTVCAE